MSDFDSEEPSTRKTIDLKARLERAMSQHENRIQQIETDAFASFENDLKASLSDARRTLASDLEAVSSTFSSHRQRLTKEIAKDTRRMLWLIKIPLLTTILICVTVMGLGLLWFWIQNQNRVHFAMVNRSGRTFLVIDEPTWNLCTEATTEKLSRDKYGRIQRLTTVYEEPCKPVE